MADNEETPETTMTEEPIVDCDGGGGALGHPRVFLTFDASGRIECPYCGRKFGRKHGGASGH